MSQGVDYIQGYVDNAVMSEPTASSPNAATIKAVHLSGTAAGSNGMFNHRTCFFFYQFCLSLSNTAT
jgi:hypothetical protein